MDKYKLDLWQLPYKISFSINIDVYHFKNLISKRSNLLINQTYGAL